MALDVENISNSHFVSLVAQKVFDIESLNLIGMVVSICCCVPGVLFLGFIQYFRVIALELVKNCNFVLEHLYIKKYLT
jgi:hypothetical protein